MTLTLGPLQKDRAKKRGEKSSKDDEIQLGAMAI